MAERQIKEVKDRHYQFRKSCKNIYEDLKTLEDYEMQMKKEKKKNNKAQAADGGDVADGEDIPAEKLAKPTEDDPAKKDGEAKDEEEEEPVTVDCDLLFIMDCTGSMSSYINMCRTQLFLIVEQVKKQFSKSVLKIGFVGYRDFGDSNQFDIYPFTTEYDKLKAFINGLSASGGNDTAEDVAGAFQKALEMEWTCEAKYAVLITDAYPHGNKYYKNNSGDRYPNGDPEGRVPENQIVQMIKKGITFYGLDVAAMSNQMYQIFNQVVLRQTGKNMERIAMGNAQQAGNSSIGGELPAFAKAISTSVTNTITQTITAKTLKSQKDVFNSKIMRIINNNRKFDSRFSKTGMSSKTDDDSGMEEYNKFRGRYYDNNSSDSSDEFFDNDSDDDEYFYAMRGDYSMQRNMHASNMHHHSSHGHGMMSAPEPKRGNVAAPVYRRQQEVEKFSEYGFGGRSHHFMDKETSEELDAMQLSRKQQRKREENIENVEGMIHEDFDEEIEEADDEVYVEKRRTRHHGRGTNSSASTSATSLSDAEFLEMLEAEGFKPCIRHEIIQEDFREEQEEIIPPFAHKDEAYGKTAPVAREKKRGPDDDSRERRIDPYIKKVSETEVDKTFSSICYSFQIDDSIAINWEEPQLVQNQIKTILVVKKEKFSEGAMRDAFLAQDKDFEIELAAKLHKEVDLNRKYNFLKNELTALILAGFFLTEFNQRILFTMEESQLPPQILRFVDCYIYEVREDEESSSYFYSVENLMKGDFQKYNNNAGYVIEGDMRKESQVSQAFSHFTWQYSQGNCMVVDLQGTEDGQLTDPQIHTLKKTKKFGQGDLGYEGILRFFRTHECNPFCKGLQLIHPKFHKDVKEGYQFEDFHGLQLQQKEKLQQLKEKFNYDDDIAPEAEQPEEESKENPEKKEEEAEAAAVPAAEAEAEEPKPLEIVLPDIDHEVKLAESKKYVTCDSGEDGIFGIDDFFGLEVDEKLVKAYVPPDPAKIAAAKVKKTTVAATVPRVNPDTGEYHEGSKDCTRLICSLCKKVAEYNTKLLLQQKKKLNQLICKPCQELSDKSDKMAFDCSLCKNDFEISAYVLKMKRIDKASRCEKCSLF